MENKLDGNAAAGDLQTIFRLEMTRAIVTCLSCGASNLIGETSVYMSGMGTVVRCPACSNALIRTVLANGRRFLDLRGSRVLELPAEF